MNTMDFKDFTKAVAEQVKDMLPERNIELQDVTKNNGLVLTGLVIKEKDNPIAPTIYLNSFYEKYQDGTDLACIGKEIAEAYNNSKGFPVEGFDIGSLLNFNKAREQLRFKIINYDKNIKQYQENPHRKYLDLMVVYYLDVSTDKDERGKVSITVNKHIFDAWGVTEEELFNTALKNTEQAEGVTIVSMVDIMAGFMSENAGDEEMSIEEQLDAVGEIPMFVITNQCKMNGAGVILYPDCLQRIKEHLHSNFYILPSSTHEVIAVPTEYGTETQALLSMVREVNEDAVSVEERLSDNIYCFEDSELKLITA